MSLRHYQSALNYGGLQEGTEGLKSLFGVLIDSRIFEIFFKFLTHFPKNAKSIDTMGRGIEVILGFRKIKMQGGSQKSRSRVNRQPNTFLYWILLR